MIQSMTGYGKATAELSDKKINVEIKSLNSKNLYSSILLNYPLPMPVLKRKTPGNPLLPPF